MKNIVGKIGTEPIEMSLLRSFGTIKKDMCYD